MKTNLGYDEIVDTIGDGVELGEKIGRAFSDGVQWQDSLIIVGESQNIQEIVRDAPIAWAQFKDLSPEEAVQAEQDLAKRLNIAPTDVKNKIKGALNLLARTYVLFDDYANYFDSFKKEAA